MSLHLLLDGRFWATFYFNIWSHALFDTAVFEGKNLFRDRDSN